MKSVPLTRKALPTGSSRVPRRIIFVVVAFLTSCGGTDAPPLAYCDAVQSFLEANMAYRASMAEGELTQAASADVGAALENVQRSAPTESEADWHLLGASGNRNVRDASQEEIRDALESTVEHAQQECGIDLRPAYGLEDD